MFEVIKMGFAERLRALREDNDEKQSDIARLLNVSGSMISFYENGVHFPRDEKMLLKIAEHFDVSMDYLFGLTDIPNYKRIKSVMSDLEKLPPDAVDRIADYVEYVKFCERR